MAFRAFLSVHLGPLGAVLGPSWASWEPGNHVPREAYGNMTSKEALLGLPEALLGASWANFGASWAVLGVP
eukprot:2477293-Pyramimonas_sp.AAC.1